MLTEVRDFVKYLLRRSPSRGHVAVAPGQSDSHTSSQPTEILELATTGAKGPYRRRKLEQLLSELFDEAELKRFISLLPRQHEIGRIWPASGSLEQVVHNTVLALERRGRVDRSLFVALRQERPARSCEVSSVEVLFASNR